MELRVFIRGNIGREYPNNYLDVWGELPHNEGFKALKKRKRRNIPTLSYSKSSGLCVVVLEGYDWLYFLEREYLPRVSPLFYYVWGDEGSFSQCLFPFYCAALRLQHEHGGQFRQSEFTRVLETELHVRRARSILTALSDAGLVLLMGDYVSASSFSDAEMKSASIKHQIAASWRDGKRPASGKARQSTATTNPSNLSAYGLDRQHASHLSTLLGSCISLRRMADECLRNFSSSDRIAFERGLIPHVHNMLNHFLYSEALELLTYCQRRMVDAPLAREQIEKHKRQFEGRAEQFIGGLLAEVCGVYDVECYAAVLPTVVRLIEDGILYPRRTNGPYQVFGRVQLRSKADYAK